MRRNRLKGKDMARDLGMTHSLLSRLLHSRLYASPERVAAIKEWIARKLAEAAERERAA